jgi:integrase/recombinase XerD
VSPNTIKSYKDGWRAFNKYGKAEISESGVKDFVIQAISAGLKPGAVNAFARSMNSFLTWLFETGHIKVHLKVPLQKTEKKVLQTYKPEDVVKIISSKPVRSTQKRVLAILLFLIDTGARVNEALTLTRKNVDFENLLVTLKGKGSKERRIPISLECRKALYRWMQTHNHELVFCSCDGNKLRYDNLRRDFLSILDAVGVEKSEGSFHAFRRFFGKQYIRNGGNLLYLQKTFGHSTLEMTKRYVEADEEDLQLAHKSLSPLERLKSRR